MGWGQILGTAVGGWFGGTTGAGIGAGLGGMLDQKESDSYNSAEAAKQRDASLNASSTTYQRTMADMQAAGLNPMLAYSQGGSSVGSMASTQRTNVVDSGGNSAAAYRSAEAAERSSLASLTSADANQMQAMAAMKNASTASAKAEAEIGLIKINSDKVLEETRNLPFERTRIIATAKMLDTQSALMEKQGFSEVERRQVLTQTIAKLKSETDLNTLDIQAAMSLDNLGREAQQLRPIIEMIRMVFGGRR